MSAPNQNASLVVQRLDRAAALSVTTGLPRKCLVFGDDGAIQAIDATGVVRNLASSSGSIIPTDDDADSLGSASLRWRGGYFGTDGVMTPSLSSRTGGVSTRVATLTAEASAVEYLDIESGATGNGVTLSAVGVAGNVDIYLTPKGSGTLLVGAGGLQAATIQGQTISLGGVGTITLGGSSRTISSNTTLTISANTGLTLSIPAGTMALDVGTATLQLGNAASAIIGEYGVAGTGRSAAIPDATLGATIDTQARAAINALLAYFRLRGTVTP